MSNARLFDFEGLNENFSFLVLKIHQQLEDTLITLQHVDGFIPERMNNREDYIDNLKIIIERKSYKRALKARSEEDRTIRIMGSLNTATSNLEEIGDYLMNIVTQTRYFQDRAFLGQYNYQAYFHEIAAALDLVAESLLKGKIKDALQICHAEIKIDNLFKNDFAALLAAMQETRKIGDAITTLNILRYLERIGDSLLNVGEAIISAYAGTRLKLFEYMAIKDSLRRDTGEFLFQGLEVETKSGCRIEKIVTKDDARENQEVIFKEGSLAKIQQEKEKIEQWQCVMSGLTPKVYGFEYLNEKAFILLEYIGGFNFQEIVLRQDRALLEKAFNRVKQVTLAVWEKTRQPQPVRADFMGQLKKRLPDVYEVHPSLSAPSRSISTLKQPSLPEKIARAAAIEQTLPAPFSVFIHGDFNTDNIIYNEQDDRIVFIDPHRSGYTDYIQDISVFLVSNYRIPVLDAKIRESLVGIIRDFYAFARKFAEANGDVTFDARLALGVSRSFISSTRFILKEDFAKAMYLRGVYLLDKFLDHDGRPWTDFRLPEDVFLY